MDIKEPTKRYSGNVVKLLTHRLTTKGKSLLNILVSQIMINEDQVEELAIERERIEFIEEFI